MEAVREKTARFSQERIPMCQGSEAFLFWLNLRGSTHRGSLTPTFSFHHANRRIVPESTKSFCHISLRIHTTVAHTYMHIGAHTWMHTYTAIFTWTYAHTHLLYD